VHEPAAIDTLQSTEPTADEAVAFLEDVKTRIDAIEDDRLREIVLLRLEGWGTDEIADKLHVHRRTVQRKLSLVERTWLEQDET
jgi:DNA-directed RNA polymerase specialized sigma24 family protein